MKSKDELASSWFHAHIWINWIRCRSL